MQQKNTFPLSRSGLRLRAAPQEKKLLEKLRGERHDRRVWRWAIPSSGRVAFGGLTCAGWRVLCLS